jgi:hypothetical protein
LFPGNLHLNIVSPEFSDKVLDTIEPYVYEFTGEQKGSGKLLIPFFPSSFIKTIPLSCLCLLPAQLCVPFLSSFYFLLPPSLTLLLEQKAGQRFRGRKLAKRNETDSLSPTQRKHQCRARNWSHEDQLTAFF